MGKGVMILVRQGDDGDEVYVNGELQHSHNWRSVECEQKWLDLIEKYFSAIAEIKIEDNTSD